MSKPEHEFFPVTDIPWTSITDQIPGLTERVLARESESEAASRILRFEPGTDTTPMGVQQHTFWEEVYILEGYMHDLTLDQKFPAGTFACRPPGMRHGPWMTPEGCVTFEVRYTKHDQI